MPHNLRLELINNLNLLRNLAAKGLDNFPNEVCLFLTDEINLKSAAIFIEKKKNKFDILSKPHLFQQNVPNHNLEINNYDAILSESKFETNFSSNCELKEILDTNLQSIVFKLTDEKLGILILQHKVIPSITNQNKYIPVANLIAELLRSWGKSNSNLSVVPSNYSDKFLHKSIKSFVKEIKTVNGLITLMQDESNFEKVLTNLEEIKSVNNFIVESFSDLLKILKSSDKNSSTKSRILIKDLIDDIVNSILQNNTYNLTNVIDTPILINRELLSKILKITLVFSGNVAGNKNVLIQTSITGDNKLHIGIVAEDTKLKPASLTSLLSPFENREFLNNISGLSLSLVQKYVTLLDGTLNPFLDNSDLHINISIPVSEIKENEKVVSQTITPNRDKILVIESDSASTTLLNNYLSKWNYETEFVNSGEVALKRLKENKYVSVILNVEQENDNSLELLQKIKNNKATRNTPVIVFTLEAEKEKIYLMGSVEYLVKPINYNNLVEILTSYKLRRNSTVLCVDDDQPTLNLVKQAVQTAGFNVIAEYRPEFVLDLIKEKDLDLAIIDLDMPKISGFDLIKSIKAEDKFSKLPIIIYTGKEDYQEDLQKIDGLFVDLLDKKSTSFNELENTISAMIKSYEESQPIEEIKESSDSPKILMAEDYKHSQIIVTRLLKKSGFENVIVVENGEEALNICKKEKIDLILMDMQMPVMNGFEATGKIRELDGYADTPIISLTAFAMKGDREKCLESGATDYIPKPIDSKEFIEKVKYYTQVKVES